MNKMDRIILWVWAAISILVCLMSLDLGVGTFSAPGPGLFPLVFAILLGSISMIYLISSYLPRFLIGRAQVKAEEVYWRRPGFVILSMVIYSLLLHRIGFLVCTFILLFVLFTTASRPKREWKVSGIGAFATVVASYIIFSKFLQIPLPRGILGF
jgi:putative tricarboxylic transport membrane protein